MHCIKFHAIQIHKKAVENKTQETELTGGLSCSGAQRDFCKLFFHMWQLGLASFPMLITPT